MTVEPRDQALTTARLWQPLVCLSLLAAIGLSVTGLMAAVRCDALGAWTDRKWAEINDTPNQYTRLFLDHEDRIVLRELPQLDTSRGGVYFFGSSNMTWATHILDMPPAQRRLIHNFAGGEGTPYFSRQLLEYLVSHKHLLAAGADRTLVIYATGFVNLRRSVDNRGSVFSNMWRRHDLYTYDFEKGIEPRDFGPWLEPYFLEKARAASFVAMAIDRLGRLALPKSLRRRHSSKIPAEIVRRYETEFGTDWQDELAAHGRELQGLYDYVHGQGMNFAVVMLPLASWHEPLPYPPKYRAMIDGFCRKNGVRLIDFSHSVRDDGFLDHIHVNARGLEKTHAALIGIARDFLKEKGIWPAE